MKKSYITLFVLLLVSILCMFLANLIQTDFGKVNVSEGFLSSPAGDLAYKIYMPKGASESNKHPGVLLLHGYQNDHETCGAYAIELAKRGAVVLAIDEYGHGKTVPSLLERGYVNHKVSVNYGLDSKENKTYVEIGGELRYRVLMNFSNLSFFDDYYSKDSDGNSIKDSSAGGIAAYAFLASLAEVDPARISISGHSMGTWSSWSVAAKYANAKDSNGVDISPKAVVLQCGELFTESVYDSKNIKFNNVLLLQAKYEEFSYFRDYQLNVTDELLKTPLRYNFLNTTKEEAKWNTTYGSFIDGSARRIELLNTNHRLTTHHKGGLKAAIDWIDNATKLPNMFDSSKQNAMVKENLVLIAMLCVLFAMLPLMNILLSLSFFNSIVQELPPVSSVKSNRAIFKGGLITILIAAATYPFMTQLGHGLLPLNESIFRMTVGNGFITWYSLLIIIMLLLTFLPRLNAKRKGKSIVSIYELGLGSIDNKEKVSLTLLVKCGILAFILISLVYVMNLLFEITFKLDLRYIWPFFKSFNITRFGQFLIYFPFFALFYILNNSKIFASFRTKATSDKSIKGFFKCLSVYALIMVGGVLVVTLIEYIPFFLGVGPGADILFSSTFGGPFMSILILFIPQVLIFSVICTYSYRRSGSIYIGAFLAAIISCWIVTGGSSIL